MKKHLAGQHSQQTHANKTIKGRLTPELIEFAVNNTLKTSKHAATFGDLVLVDRSTVNNTFTLSFSKSNVSFSVDGGQNTGFSYVRPVLPSIPSPKNITGEQSADFATELAKSLGIEHVSIHSRNLKLQTLVSDGYVMVGGTLRNIIDNHLPSYNALMYNFTTEMTAAIKKRKPDTPDLVIHERVKDEIKRYTDIKDGDVIKIADAPLAVTYGLSTRMIVGLAHKEVV